MPVPGPRIAATQLKRRVRPLYQTARNVAWRPTGRRAFQAALVVPNWEDRIAGEPGLASINVDAGGYADSDIFGSSFKVHSVAADLWAHFGWVGVALVAAMVGLLVRSLSFLVAGPQAPTYMIFGCMLALWFVPFGPMHSNWLDVCVALGLPPSRPEAADADQTAA